MDEGKVLVIVLREMTAFGRGWRNDWSDFDGRRLRDQLDDLEHWAWHAVNLDDSDYTAGTEFYCSR